MLVDFSRSGSTLNARISNGRSRFTAAIPDGSLLYLHFAQSGALLLPLTSGSFCVTNVQDLLPAKKKTVTFHFHKLTIIRIIFEIFHLIYIQKFKKKLI